MQAFIRCKIFDEGRRVQDQRNQEMFSRESFFVCRLSLDASSLMKGGDDVQDQRNQDMFSGER